MKPLYFLFSVALLLATACKPEEPVEPEPQPAAHTNYNPAQHNALMQGEQQTGDAGVTSYYHLKVKANGNTCYAGMRQGAYVAGELNSSQQRVWEYTLTFVPWGLEILNGNSTLSGGVLVYGTDDAGTRQQGILLTLDNTGRYLDDVVVAPYSYLSLRDAELFEATSTEEVFILAGSGGADRSTIFPYIDFYAVNKTTGKIMAGASSLTRPAKRLLTEYPQFVLNDLSVSTLAGGGDRVFKAALYQYNSDADRREKPALAKLHIGLKSGVIADPSVDWLKEIAFNNTLWKTIQRGEGGLVDLGAGNGMVVTGFGESTDNKNTPSGGGYFQAAFAARYDDNGNAQWVREYSFTRYDDNFQRCVVLNGALYAAGQHSSYSQNSGADFYGNGLVAKISLNDGALLDSKTFGYADTQNGVNALVSINGQLLAGGFANYVKSTSSSKGWSFRLSPF